MNISSTATTTASPTAATTASSTASTTARAADGDYKVRSSLTAQVKDADGDYAPVAKSAMASSSSEVQASLTKLTLGGV